MARVRAFVVSESAEGFSAGVARVDVTRKDAGDVLVAVDFSGVNYKDVLVARPASRVRRVASLVGGVDAAGAVVESADPSLPVGARVAVHGGDLGVARDGGFAELVYAPARFLNVLPEAVSTRDAMVIGTAGFTAMASVLALEDHGLSSRRVGPRHRGHGRTWARWPWPSSPRAATSVTASTGSSEEESWLRGMRRRST